MVMPIFRVSGKFKASTALKYIALHKDKIP